MSASQAPALDAIAFQLLAALEKYDRDVAAMLESWPDLELYHAASKQIDEVRMYSSSLHDVRVQWVELLINHAELVHCLWRVEYGSQQVAREKAAEIREHHADAIAALRNRCLRVISWSSQKRP